MCRPPHAHRHGSRLAEAGNTDHGHENNFVENVVEHSVITNANPPSMSFTHQLFAPWRAGIAFETVNAGQNAPPNTGVQLSQFLGGCGGEFNAVRTHASNSARNSSRLTQPPSSIDFAARYSATSRNISNCSSSSKSSGPMRTAAGLPFFVICTRS